MRTTAAIFLATLMLIGPARAQAPAASAASDAPDPAGTLVSRLDFEQYKATIKGLTAFGDREQGTDRNRAAVDWIEARLRSYGCSNTARLTYHYSPSEPEHPSGRWAADATAGCATRPT